MEKDPRSQIKCIHLEVRHYDVLMYDDELYDHKLYAGCQLFSKCIKKYMFRYHI